MASSTEQLVRAAIASGVRDERVLEALRSVPRHHFVPDDQLHRAYRDRPLPIGHDQVTTQPSLVAAMVEALQLSGSERVLEVGTGLGYQAAILGQLAAEVWSVERFQALAEQARANLAAAGVDHVAVVLGDGTQGLAEHAPYDAIVVAAAYPQVPPPLVEQLRVGGTLVQPVGPGGAEDVTLFVRDQDGLVAQRSVIGAHFVPLHGRHGFPT
ncbi:MAG: protein-L-isoaspartate(D-aspartate) O-methyltransferase [Actinomycetota bacterium]|nr:protein-L-isoaspartate(D-aspartate) O-methyltransferase [Actinomycetota bacterium]